MDFYDLVKIFIQEKMHIIYFMPHLLDNVYKTAINVIPIHLNSVIY